MNFLLYFLAGLNALTVGLRFYLSHYIHFHSGCQWADPSAEIKLAAFGDPQITGTSSTTSYRKQLDVYGNDYYLGHIYSTILSQLKPTHVTVMGDLVSSQWIDDLEFYARARRYKQRIFKARNGLSFFNISGNHDIGYGGEMTTERIDRFERIFGSLNFDIVYNYDGLLPYRIVGINSLALDGPNFDPQYKQNVQQFLETLRNQQFQGATILLTHVPLYKPAGICQDGPDFAYYDNGNIREQNHLSQESTGLVLDSLFHQENKYGGVILTGHDHEGCNCIYENKDKGWQPYPGKEGWQNCTSDDLVQNVISEHTVRSMMGEYGGNTGLLTGKFNSDTQRWEFNYQLCPFVVQHLWWISKVFAYMTLALDSLTLILFGFTRK